MIRLETKDKGAVRQYLIQGNHHSQIAGIRVFAKSDSEKRKG
jgi:hypothetical protein